MAQAPLHTLLHTLSQKSHVFVYAGFLAIKIMFSLFMQTQHRNCMCISQHAEIASDVVSTCCTLIQRTIHSTGEMAVYMDS